MATQYDEELDEDELERRQRPPAPIGKPIAAVPPSTATTGSTAPPVGPVAPPTSVGKPIVQPSSGATAPLAQAPQMPVQAQPDAAPVNIGTPITPEAPHPAGDRLSQMTTQGPPHYHGIKRVLDTLAGATRIGTAIEGAGGIGTKGYEANLGRAREAAGTEEAQIGEGEKERQAEAQTELTGATAGEAEARGEAAKAGMEDVIITRTDPRTGQQVSERVPRAQVGRVLVPEITSEGAQARETQRETAAQKLQSGKPITMDELASQATQEGDQATLQKVEDYKKTIAAAGKQEPGNFVPVNDANGNVVGWANPKSRDWVPAGAIAGGAVTQAAGGQGATSIPAKPTAIEHRMGKMAEYSGTLIDDAASMIQDARSQLGPGAGRWNQFVAGQIGLKNVDWTGINAQLTFVTGALTLAHSQGRVSNLIMEQFARLLDAGKQDPDNLLEALKIAKKAMAEVQSTMGTGGNAPASAPDTGGAGTPSFDQWKGKK